jgi:hypothetical protein
VTVGDAVVLVQAAAVLLLVVRLVQCEGWGLLVLQGLLVVVEGERKMWVDHNTLPEYIWALCLQMAVSNHHILHRTIVRPCIEILQDTCPHLIDCPAPHPDFPRTWVPVFPPGYPGVQFLFGLAVHHLTYHL